MDEILASKYEFRAADAYYATKESISDYREQKAKKFMETEQFQKIVNLIKERCSNRKYILSINLKDYDCNWEDVYYTFTKLGYIVKDYPFKEYKDCVDIRWNMNNEIS